MPSHTHQIGSTPQVSTPILNPVGTPYPPRPHLATFRQAPLTSKSMFDKDWLSRKASTPSFIREAFRKEDRRRQATESAQKRPRRGSPRLRCHAQKGHYGRTGESPLETNQSPCSHQRSRCLPLTVTQIWTHRFPNISRPNSLRNEDA